MRVTSVNVARASRVSIAARTVRSAIGKRPVDGRVAVGPLGIDGDEQADHRFHGGPKKAVYAYPQAHYAFWQTVRAQAGVALWDEPLAPGSVGENLTIDGLLEDQLWLGDRLRLPGCLLVVSEPRTPCFKFNAAMGFPQASDLMWQSGFCGSYLAVVEPGDAGADDAVELVPGPRELNLREWFRSKRPR